MTSLLRDETPFPIPFVASATITSCPARAAARPTASPTTPAPTTRICMGALAQRALAGFGLPPPGGRRVGEGVSRDTELIPSRFATQTDLPLSRGGVKTSGGAAVKNKRPG